MDDTAFGANMEVPYMDSSVETISSSGELGAERPEALYSDSVILNRDNDSAEHTGAEVSVVFTLEHLLLRVLTLFSIISNYVNNDSVSESNAGCPTFLFRILAIFSCCSRDNKSLTVPRVAGNFENEFVEFMPGLRRYIKNSFGRELQENEEHNYRQLLSFWNTFLQPVQGNCVLDTSANISADIKDDIKKFIPWLVDQQGEQWTRGYKIWMKKWLPEWNMFLMARAGQTPVTRWNLFLTIVGFIFYIIDLGSDIGTSVYYAANGQWWRAMGTLTIVYGAVIFHTVMKWIDGQIHFTGAADWLRHVAASLVNWQDLKQYGALFVLERNMFKSPAENAHLIPKWHERRTNVALLKFTEGICEACPQAILQLCLLLPDLHGQWTWTDYLRIAGACVSLCTAGAALVNMEKFRRNKDYTNLSLSELVALHVWAVPVTVSRLLCVALVLSVHPYWVLAGIAIFLVLCGVTALVYWCQSNRRYHVLTVVISMCMAILLFCMSPFHVAGTVTFRRVYHAVHFLVTTAMMVVWALGTPLVCALPALYTAIICFNTAMMTVGLVGMELHGKYWPDRY